MLKPTNLKQPGAANISKPGFRASVTAAGEFEILLYDEIGENWYGEGITAKSIRQSLDAAGAFSRIAVRINSPGGDAFEGIAIGNILKSTGKAIDVYIDGIAASAASIVAMAGGSIVMCNNSMMMIHNAWTVCMGDAADMAKMSDTLDKISTSIAQTYVDRTGKPMDEIKAMMDAETWLGADECVAGGFATEIAEANEPAVAMARGFKVLNRLKHVPAALRNGTKKGAAPDGCACNCQACMDDDCANCSNAECNDPDCIDCPMQSDAGNSSDLSQCLARLAVIQTINRRHGVAT
jgi:ATP-dependent protease ClpP protease subunit